MQKSSRIAEISTKVVGGATFFMFTLYVHNELMPLLLLLMMMMMMLMMLMLCVEGVHDTYQM